MSETPYMTMQYGLRPRKLGLPSLKFEAIRRVPAQPAAEAPSVQQPRFLPTTDYLTPYQSWEFLGNDTFGDCVAVAWANQRRLVTSTLGQREVYPTLDQVVTFYKTQNPNFDPNGLQSTNGPKSKEDNGMYIQEALDYLRTNGGPDGVKPIAFAEVNAKDLSAVHQAISIFGSLWIGLKVYQSTENQWLNGRQPWWSPPSGTPIKSRHSVLVGAYVPQKRFVTWAETTEFDDSYWLTGDVDEAWAVIWPEHVGTRNFMTGVNLDQLSLEMKKLTGTALDIAPAPPANIYFIKTQNQASGMTEVHVADRNSLSADTVSLGGWRTGFGPDEGRNGVFRIHGGDLYFIKFRNTDSGTVEVHRTTATSKFADFDIHTATGWVLGGFDPDDGTWTMDGGDVYFIKIRNVEFGWTEIYRLHHLDWKAAPTRRAVPALSLAIVHDGFFCMFSGDLFFIRHKRTVQNAKIEVHMYDGNHDWMTRESLISTQFSTFAAFFGRWFIGPNRDLYFVNTVEPDGDNGKVMLQVADAASQYQDIVRSETWFDPADEANGTWWIE